jgi:hypothetical protein
MGVPFQEDDGGPLHFAPSLIGGEISAALTIFVVFR